MGGLGHQERVSTGSGSVRSETQVSAGLVPPITQGACPCPTPCPTSGGGGNLCCPLARGCVAPASAFCVSLCKCPCFYEGPGHRPGARFMTLPSCSSSIASVTQAG